MRSGIWRGAVLAVWVFAGPAGAVAAGLCAVTAIEGGAARVQRGGALVELALGPLAGTDGRIETGADTRLQVTCDDGNVVTVGPDSRIDLHDLLAVAQEDASIIVQLLEGIAGFVGPERARTGLEVQTPVAVAAVRSTEWLVEHAAETGSSVFVRSGRVAVSNAVASFVLEPGEGITLDRDTVIRPVARWGPPRIEQVTGALGFGWD